MSNVLLGVALYPNQPTTDEARAIGRDFVGPRGTVRWCELVIEPYCLVYQALFASDAGSMVTEIVNEVAAEEPVIATSLGEFGIQDGHLSWITARTDWRRLRLLQERMLEHLAPHRATQSMVMTKRNRGTDVLRENLYRYGYRYCGEFFVPQLRLAYLSDLTSAMNSLPRLTPRSRSCSFERIGAVAMSPETGGLLALSEARLVA